MAGIVRFDPLRELTPLQSEMARWFAEQTQGGASTWLPSVDLDETEKEFVLSFDLPGLEEDEISVELDENVLTVSGERERTAEGSEGQMYRYERRFGRFSRSITLPVGIKEEEIKANYKNGVLEVRVPKPEETKPKRIQIGEHHVLEGKGKGLN